MNVGIRIYRGVFACAFVCVYIYAHIYIYMCMCICNLPSKIHVLSVLLMVEIQNQFFFN